VRETDKHTQARTRKGLWLTHKCTRLAPQSRYGSNPHLCHARGECHVPGISEEGSILLSITPPETLSNSLYIRENEIKTRPGVPAPQSLLCTVDS